VGETLQCQSVELDGTRAMLASAWTSNRIVSLPHGACIIFRTVSAIVIAQRLDIVDGTTNCGTLDR